MKTSNSLNPSKSPESIFKDKVKQFWNKKEGKLIVLSVIAILLTSGIVFGVKSGLIDSFNQGKQNSTLVASTLSSIQINAESLEYGSPLTLVDEKGNIRQILNGQNLTLEPGKYTVSSLVDAGNGKAKGIKEQIMVTEKENKKIDLEFKNVDLDQSKSSEKVLPVASKIESINGIEVKTIKVDNNQTKSVNISSSNTDTSQALKYPKLILSPDRSSKIGGNNESTERSQINQTVAIIQPLLSKTNLIKTDTPNSASSKSMSNISKEQSSSLAIVSEGEQKILAEGCLVGKVEFNKDGSLLRYFKACDNGQNGFYQYDIKTKKEIAVLPSSDYSNVLKIVSSPVSDLMVWTKPDLGQFGIIQNGQFEVVLSKVFYTSPYFSPDGKYLIVMDNYLANKSPKEIESFKLSQSDQDQFGMKVKVVEVQDLIQNKEKAVFKDVGTTYYLPRQINYNLDFIRFTDSTHFMAGDGSKIFSLDGEAANTKLVSDLPGRIYELANGKKYRHYREQLFNDQNQVLANQVNQIVQLDDKSMYFKSGDFLFRLVEDVPVQAFDKPISNISANQNQLQLVQSDGNITTFTV